MFLTLNWLFPSESTRPGQMGDSVIPPKINLLTDSFIIGDGIATQPASCASRSALSSSQHKSAKGNRGGAEEPSLLQGHPVPQSLQAPQKALAPEKGALGLIRTLLLTCPVAIVHPFPSLGFSAFCGKNAGGRRLWSR